MILPAALLGALGCASPPPLAPESVPSALPGAPDLVMIGIAGLRSDPRTRAAEWFQEAFAGEQGAVYANAYAQSPSTFVSLGSTLGGRYPSALPLCGLPTDPGEGTAAPPWCNSWPAGQPSLPTVLALYGYRTALVVADVPGAEHLAPLFEEAVTVSARWQNTATDWDKVQSVTSAWWAADKTRPRLLVVVTADLQVHDNPGLRAAMVLDSAGPGGAPSHMDLPRVSDIYARAARVAGQGAKALLDALGPNPARERWAALFGTNGVNLGDSAVPAHALRARSWNDLLLDRTVHVPLALVGPRSSAHVVPDIVELVDLAPTLLTLAGAVVPAGWPGRDLLASGTSALESTAYAEFGDMLSVRSGTRMWSVRAFFHNRSALDPELTNFILDYEPDERRYALHDLENDPFQQRNLLLDEPDEARRLHHLLVGLRTGPAAPPVGALDARRIWELRMAPSEGYW